jgi:hypothetical protein
MVYGLSLSRAGPAFRRRAASHVDCAIGDISGAFFRAPSALRRSCVEIKTPHEFALFWEPAINCTCDWRAAEFPRADVLEFEFFTDGRTVTLLECYASEAAHQRHFARWASSFAGRMAAVLVLKDIHIYGRGISAVPRDWEPFMSTLENPLERNHKGPVGKI